MKRVALGLQMHSGWGVLVAVSWDHRLVEVLARTRIVTIDPRQPGAQQPYHYLAQHPSTDPKQYLSERAEAATSLAAEAIAASVEQYRPTGAAVLWASGRPLPPLAKILAAHPLLHTAEGEFFRATARDACERLHIPATVIREKELEERLQAALGKSATEVQRTVDSFGKSFGPPWTKDHKTAALAAVIVASQVTGN
jgi:hypothetical protein